MGLLLISMTAALMGSILKKYYTDKTHGRLVALFLFHAVGALLSAGILFFWGGVGAVSLFTVILGMAFGAVTSLQGVATLAALNAGPMSYTNMIISFSTLITAVSGALFFHERLEVAHIIGIVLVLISFVLAVEKKQEERGKSVRWLFLSLIAFFCTGGIGVMQKIHQTSPYREERNVFLVIAFATSFVISAMLALIAKRKEYRPVLGKQGSEGYRRWMLVVCLILNGCCIAVNNKLNLYLSGVMDSAVFFPVVNGGGLVLSTLAAVLIFREKLSKKQWVGLTVGILSVILLCNPFR